ncbi:hypothetical protein CU041_16860 [Thalassospira povalilytica]|uniref:Uncharacterized protein n=1 Tax=Thalassospira povalilytica TaxID=732237 RepID=A0ABX4R5H4_9PROT|nr:hypothetical protein CU041_16860 [Thalassospira povalilytica]
MAGFFIARRDSLCTFDLPALRACAHNLKAEAVKKSLQWSDFKLKVEHGDSRAQTALVGHQHIYPIPVCRFFAKTKDQRPELEEPNLGSF